jgi:Flp pilus assembly protein CpaB
MTYRVRNILIAVGLAAVAGMLTLFYVTSYKHRVDKAHQEVTVLVAAHDIPVGALGAQLGPAHMLSTEQVARKAIVPGLITDPKQVSNEIVTQPIYQGEQVTARRFGPITEQGIRTQLKGTYRAMQVKGDANQLLAGTIHESDHVDVVASIKVPDEASQKHFAKVVLRDLLVLRTSGAADSSTKIINPNGGSWVMLRVTDAQSQKLEFVTANDDWSLALRPALQDADSPSSVEDAISILRAGSAKASSSAPIKKKGRR